MRAKLLTFVLQSLPAKIPRSRKEGFVGAKMVLYCPCKFGNGA